MYNDIDTSSAPVNLSQLADKIRAAHQAVVNAANNALDSAMAAGDALIAARNGGKIRHGDWARWLGQHCDLRERTARVYIQLAQNRELIGTKRQHAAELSLRGALRLIAGENSSADGSPKKKSPAATLSTLAWSEATPEQRRRFLDGIGLISLLAAIPPTWHAEIERRVEGLHKVKTDKLSDAVAKALRQALSLQKAHKGDGMAPCVAAALNAVNNLLVKAGADLNEISGITLDENLTKARAKSAA
jgi:hypothetical protein